MIAPPVPANEEARLKALRLTRLLDTPPEADFDRIVRLASTLCDTPIALVTLVDRDRQWFKANHGLPEVTQTDRKVAFCAHAILEDGVLMVSDATREIGRAHV